MRNNSKEQIKNRMIAKAAAMWGVAANEIEMSFDPIVSLLISACASEIEKISAEVDESQTRITEKVIQLMTPETANGPKPAQAILYAEPIEDTVLIKPEFLFNYRKRNTYQNTSVQYKDVYFSPVQEFKLLNGNIQFLAMGDTIVEQGEKKSRKVILKNSKKVNLPPSTLYLGISSEVKTLSFKNISIYFELQGGATKKELFYHHLRNAEWFVAGRKLEVINGMSTSNKEQILDLKSIFEDVSNKTNNTSNQIVNSFSKNYCTIKDTKGVKDSSFEEVETLFEKNKIKTDESLRWIKIVFPRIVDHSILEHVYCSLNSFPALNRELNNFTYQIKEYINILPIKTEDLFFDIKSIVNTDGKKYKARSKDNSNEDKGTFVMRSDNVGKLDKRKAKEYIVYLIELLKDESASFSFLNNDFLHNNLKGLNQLISLLEKKVSESSNDVTQTNYVVLKPYKPNESLIVDYWTTNGVEGNNIKTGSELSIYKGIGVNNKNAYFMTTSFGGKDDLSMKDRLNSYRRSLLSRDRIVTKEDVKALCYELYGDKIESVEIKRGYTKAIDLNKGLVQCIDVILHPSSQVATEEEEWEAINSNLLYFLEKNSINVFPYKIKILN